MKAIVAVVAALFTVAALGWALLAYAHSGHDGKKPARVPLPNMATYKGEQCVEPAAEMRRNHMKHILHQRDETMHKGIRTTRHSLKNCINCHADPKTGSVRGKDGFCESCHAYAAVRPDCFSCHSDKPEQEARNTAGVRPAAVRARAAENVRRAVSGKTP